MQSKPSDTMRGLGIIQASATTLYHPARPFTLPGEAEEAAEVVAELFAAMDRVGRVHTFAKGMGIAANQLGIDRCAAIVQPAGADAPPIVMLNPRIVAHTSDTDEQFEGCLSFFDVRGLVPRPIGVTVETTTSSGDLVVTEYRDGTARLIQHELDHLAGTLYTTHMRPGMTPIPVEQYRQSGQPWSYRQ